jgi:hypothetical protein
MARADVPPLPASEEVLRGEVEKGKFVAVADDSRLKVAVVAANVSPAVDLIGLKARRKAEENSLTEAWWIWWIREMEIVPVLVLILKIVL